ncbi:uncharacterized protein LOC130694942 [Daphnia carinata]|uniref:uncharacterized protein LOC130694942 n=1 Tax=Daphnia carinata TaxID=120202 RepID=UPI00257F8811|nr:uncharacterized protein LOC130694942 [Daphnia carinata]
MSQVFGVPPPLYPPQPGGVNGGTFYGEQYSPLGTLAAYKGDLIYPVFTIGFFLLGVVVVVKILLTLIGLLGAKLFHGFIPRSFDDLLERKRRSIDDNSPIDQAKLDGLTAVIMAALDSQQCQQRLMCELGDFVQQYDSAHLLANLAERLAPEDYAAHVKAFKNAGQCEEYKCGQSSSSTSNVQPGNDVATKDEESL